MVWQYILLKTGSRGGFSIKPQVAQQDHLQLAQAAADGDRLAREQVNALVHPVIDYHTNLYCKRFCDSNRYRYRCSLSKPVGTMSDDAMLCEWGNASYGWMLDDLTHPARLRKYQAKNGASLFDYVYRIANSLPFYERWKDWRFGRRINLPSYIQSLGSHAKQVFYALRNGLSLEMIAQQLSLHRSDVELLSRQIINALTRHHRLYLLDPPREQSLSNSSDDEDASMQVDVAFDDETIERQDEKQWINRAWSMLSPVEQFVLEALVINEQDAGSVLEALKVMDISLKKGTRAEDTSVQQLYYFKRKTLKKLEQGLQ